MSRPVAPSPGPARLEMDRIETPRTILRPFSEQDAEAAFRWLGDPAVMRFIPSGLDASVEDTQKRIAMYREHQTAHGFSRWVIRERASGLLIGDSGLLALEAVGGIDLGFRLAVPHWGKGFATEVAKAWVQAAVHDLGLPRLFAFSHPQNVASVRVLEKVGFRRTGAGRVMGMDAVTFEYLAEQHSGSNWPGRPSERSTRPRT